MSEKVKKTRSRSMSIEQRRVCEFFEAHPYSTRPECMQSLKLNKKSIWRKVQALVESGHLMATSNTRSPKFALTGKPFPHTDEYKTNQKWIEAKMRAIARGADEVVVMDVVAASMHAMVMVGRHAA